MNLFGDLGFSNKRRIGHSWTHLKSGLGGIPVEMPGVRIVRRISEVEQGRGEVRGGYLKEGGFQLPKGELGGGDREYGKKPD